MSTADANEGYTKFKYESAWRNEAIEHWMYNVASQEVYHANYIGPLRGS